MISSAAAIWIAIAALLAGAGIGILLYRSFHPQGKRNQALESRLAEAEQKYNDYQKDVTGHFEETARRVNNLTKHYKDVHEYLASSASKLANPTMSREFIEAAQRNLPHEPVTVDASAEQEANEQELDREAARKHEADAAHEEADAVNPEQQSKSGGFKV